MVVKFLLPELFLVREIGALVVYMLQSYCVIQSFKKMTSLFNKWKSILGKL